MAYVFREDGPWGSGKHSDLTPAEVDGNFWQAIQDIAAKAVQGVGVANIVVIGSQLTFVLTDHTLIGPFNLPVVAIVFKGEWQPDYSYQGGNIITHAGSTYIVLINHVSEATFDPGANDGNGNDFYGLLLRNPELTIPAGGAQGWVLTKATSADYVLTWAPPTVAVSAVVNTSSTAFDPVLTDAGSYTRCTSSSPVTVTIPTNASVAFPIGTSLKYRQTNTGPITVIGAGLVVINAIQGYLPTTATIGAVIEVIKIDTDEWDVFGFLEAHS